MPGAFLSSNFVGLPLLFETPSQFKKKKKKKTAHRLLLFIRQTWHISFSSDDLDISAYLPYQTYLMCQFISSQTLHTYFLPSDKLISFSPSLAKLNRIKQFLTHQPYSVWTNLAKYFQTWTLQSDTLKHKKTPTAKQSINITQWVLNINFIVNTMYWHKLLTNKIQKKITKKHYKDLLSWRCLKYNNHINHPKFFAW